MTAHAFPLRPVRNADSEGLVDLIGGVFAEYPGVVLDVELEEPELLAPAERFEAMWVIEVGGVVRGCVAARCVQPQERTRETAGEIPNAERPHVELKKMYVARELRGQGLGRRFVERVEAYAGEQHLTRIELWSDTRFETAHAVYERLGYSRTGRTRELHDLSVTTEYHFVKDLSATKPARGPG